MMWAAYFAILAPLCVIAAALAWIAWHGIDVKVTVGFSP